MCYDVINLASRSLLFTGVPRPPEIPGVLENFLNFENKAQLLEISLKMEKSPGNVLEKYIRPIVRVFHRFVERRYLLSIAECLLSIISVVTVTFQGSAVIRYV